jgi:DNA polymerase elongation subunit (family B)
MIVALDIETIGNPIACANMPEPKANKKLKDPAKIAADIAEKKAAILEKAALDPMTARVCCYAIVSCETEDNDAQIIDQMTDEAEIGIIQKLMEVFATDGMRLATYNGNGFDLPMIYKRAAILGVSPSHFGAPPLSAWTGRYNNDKHFDLMQLWCGYNEYEKLDNLAAMVLGKRKTELDVMTFPTLIATEEGRAQIREYCLKDTALTAELFSRFRGTLFA